MNTKMYIPALLVMFLFTCSCTPKITNSNPSKMKEVASINSKNLIGKRFVRQRKAGESINENPELAGPGSIDFRTEGRASYFGLGSDMGIEATYRITGNKIIVDISHYNEKKAFTMVDGKTIKDSEGNIYKAE